MSEEKKIKWKKSLNLPKTGFPMKAQLNRKEPEILKKWDKEDLYSKILKKRSDSKEYILHDGPPYANGRIHLGHALNKILKDFIIKTKSMEGFKAPYVPGWDCHGLPIEIKVDKELGPRKKDMHITDIRKKCKDYALKYLKLQKEDFKRLGINGEWDKPYMTVNPVYESNIIEFFKSFVKTGNVVRKKRPVYWCASCGTALAEAEVEYADHSSPSIYVKFALKEKPEVLKEYKDLDINVLIWTTTPWTIPANLAIAVHADFDYSLFKMDGEYHIAASRLIPVLSDIFKKEYEIIKEFKGADLKGLNAKHPLYERDSLIINTDYVELDAGTGCVHTAPGHGEDDYRAGLEYGLEIYSPVDGRGCFDKSAGKYEGQHIFKSNQVIIDDLKEAGALILQQDISHSYPHCWRCKKPIIFRATEQWFIAMDTAELRQKALAEIKKVDWLPAWGEERISNMVENRPDWCISRQRDWGVPIPVFFCKKCNEAHLDVNTIEKIREEFLNNGADIWYKKTAEELMPKGSKCSNCSASEFKKGEDILDVWFESGASFGILDNYENHRYPADLYLEGGDQYRGWFHSSLLVSVSARNQSPYKKVITHGWVLDNKGRAMSKSLGNVIEPQSIIKDRGAEILRLWVAMVNYREDIKIGNEVLTRVSEAYRKIRNTWRFMFGVLSDFSPETNSVKDSDLFEQDIYILSRLQELKKKIYDAYEKYEYHTIFHAASNFFTNDLSSFYLHFAKDNLYCNTVDSPQRRATQTVIFKLLKETLLLLAPVLSFTTEEAWEHLPEFKGKEDSVHMELFPEIEEKYISDTDKEKWGIIMKFRDVCLKEIEETRNQKILGDSLEADVELCVTKENFEIINKNRDLLKDLLVISALTVKEGIEESVKVSKSDGIKCPRCWNWFHEDDKERKFSELCPRCSKAAEELDLENL